MIRLGQAARFIRNRHSLTQRKAAEALGISVVHLCNIENDNATASRDLIDRYRELWGIDLYVLSWCLQGQTERLPPTVRKAAQALAAAWKAEIGLETETRRC